MDEEKARKLAMFRAGEEKRLGKKLTAEEITLRRQFIKTMLRGIPAWQGLTDNDVDNVRIWKIGPDWYIEDQDYYEYPF
ncbi:hypothetical protein [Lacrimispora sp.]|uniref:hypothetical protein n=1 Tax=Lacrimispora sp. TaxID=2719234 RepID=UPI00345FCE3A